MPISENHTPVKAQISRLSCGNDLQFCREQILLPNPIRVRKNPDNILLKCLFFLLLQFLTLLNRAVADQKIKILARDNLRGFLRHLLSRQVHQQICDDKHRIIILLTDADTNNSAILFRNHTMNCHGNRSPLVFLDATVIMRIKICKTILLIQRILLDINSWRVDVCPENVHSPDSGFFPTWKNTTLLSICTA